ncbi:MAG: hypothetical protein OXI35_11690 [Gemmatimonadota bacterium]|nr:hypothetical protein [Gemmatimonadota bacterium]
MRVLLDEDIDIHFRKHFPGGLTVETVEYRGWKGLKNGALLRVAQNHFDVLVTLDNNIPNQQPLQQFDIAVVVLRPSRSRLKELLELIPEIRRILEEIRPGRVERVFPPG